MKMTALRAVAFTALVPALVLLALGGCSQKDKVEGPKEDPKGVAEKKKDGEKEADDHSGWWCKEHGVPEHDCAQCDAKVAAEYKKKGDWCKEHDRPESQCFICNPKRAEKFAAAYKAKYGKEPPPLPPEAKGEKK